MLENSSFNHEWNKLQKIFWDDAGSKFTEKKNFQPKGGARAPAQYASLFDQWLKDVDKCWHEHAQETSGDIDSLFKKISSSSRFFFNFSEFFIASNQDETADILVSKYLETITNVSKAKETKESAPDLIDKNSDNINYKSSNNKNNNDFDLNAFWKLPLENWQQQAALFPTQVTTQIENQQQSVKAISPFLVTAANNLEFSAALEAYLIALQKYQQVFYRFFTKAVEEVVDALRANNNELASPTQIMTTWLEVFEVNYMALISGTEYSQVYANVVNSWMLMLSKSDQSFAEFMASAPSQSSEQV